MYDRTALIEKNYEGRNILKTQTVADRILLLCLMLGMSQQSIATITGIKLTVVNKAARGVYTPSIKVLRDIASGLKISEPWLVYGNGRIFSSRLVLLTVESDRNPGHGQRTISPQEIRSLASYVFDKEGVGSCYIVPDMRQTGKAYYVCACTAGHSVIFAADNLTMPGLNQLLTHRTDIETAVINAPSEEGHTVSKLYDAIKEMYSSGGAGDVVLNRLRDSVRGLIPDLSKVLKNMGSQDVFVPGHLAGNQRVRLLLKLFADLDVKKEEIQEAIEIYQNGFGPSR